MVNYILRHIARLMNSQKLKIQMTCPLHLETLLVSRASRGLCRENGPRHAFFTERTEHRAGLPPACSVSPIETDTHASDNREET